MLHALEQIARLAKRRGKTAGIYCQSPAYARRMTAFGYDLVTIATDSSLLVSSAQAALEAFASPAPVASDKINFDQLDSALIRSDGHLPSDRSPGGAAVR